MTEAKWLTSVNPSAMLDVIRGSTITTPGASLPLRKISDRKERLFACACCRQVWDLLPEDSILAVEVAERFADGQATLDEADCAFGQAPADVVRAGHPHWGWQDLAFTTCSTNDDQTDWYTWFRGFHIADKDAAFAVLLRDIVGTPFRPVTPPPCPTCDGEGLEDVPDGYTVPHQADCSRCGGTRHAYATPTVVALAQNAYDERNRKCLACNQWTDCKWCGNTRIQPRHDGTIDPDRLAVLADALEEADCDDRAILDHLCGPGPHVRGCWVLDLLLGRE